MKNQRSSLPLVFGRNPVKEAFAAGTKIEKVFLQKGVQAEVIDDIQHLAREQGVQLQYVPVEKLNRLTNQNHQGVVAVKALVDYMKIEKVIALLYNQGEEPFFVLLDGVTDTRNIGAIARSALCMGANALILPEKGSAMITPDAVKASAGALEHIMVCREANAVQAIKDLQMHGIKVVIAEGSAEKSVKDLVVEGPLCVVMGSEGEGADPKTMKLADDKIHIPMSGNFDSLNVSVACGILLYEIAGRRK